MIGHYLSARREHLDKFDTLIGLLSSASPPVATPWILVAPLPRFCIPNLRNGATLWLQYNYSVAADAVFGGDRTHAFEKKMCAKMHQMEAEDPHPPSPGLHRSRQIRLTS